jgi:endoglucanase
VRRWRWVWGLLVWLVPSGPVEAGADHQAVSTLHSPAGMPERSASGPSCTDGRAVAGHDCTLPLVALRRGVNLTGWFRFPVSRDPAALINYLSDQALADLRATGFDFVRLAIDPDIADPPVLIAAIQRIQRHGLAVVISPHPHTWNLEAGGDRLRSFWQTLAPRLRPLPIDRTVPEIVNEPVFPNDPGGWVKLQHTVLSDIRQALPSATVVLTGQDWGSVGGLLALPPEDDPRVIYSFHFFDPVELTSLAAYRPGLDRAALTRLPFPVDDRCSATAAQTTDPGTRDVIQYYCTLDWDGQHLAAAIDRAAAWGRRHHARVLAGEFGASAVLNPTARLAWLRSVRQTFESRGIGWALWGYDDVMGLDVPRPPAPRPALDRAVLDALGMTSGM